MMQWRKFVAVLATALAIVLVAAMLINLVNRKPPLHSFSLKYMSGPEAADLLTSKLGQGAVEGWSKGPGAVEGWNDHSVFVRGSDRVKNEVAALLAAEDKPKPPVVLKFQIIEANGFTQTDTSIAQVESVLRGLFRFNGYRLVAEAYIRTKEESVAKQMIVGDNGQQYGINVQVDKVMRREGKASAEVTTELWVDSPGLIALSNTVNMPDGQTIVLGTARTTGEGRANQQRGALILVVMPELR